MLIIKKSKGSITIKQRSINLIIIFFSFFILQIVYKLYIQFLVSTNISFEIINNPQILIDSITNILILVVIIFFEPKIKIDKNKNIIETKFNTIQINDIEKIYYTVINSYPSIFGINFGQRYSIVITKKNLEITEIFLIYNKKNLLKFVKIFEKNGIFIQKNKDIQER